MNELELRKRAAIILAAAREAQALASADGKVPSIEDTAKVDAKIAEYEATLKAADQAAKLEAAQVQLDTPRPRQTEPEVSKAAAVPVDHVAEGKKGFASFGQFADIVARSMTPGQRVNSDEMRLLAAATGMNQGVGAEGGYTVPPTFATAIWDGANQGVQALLPLTDNYTIEGESLTLPANAETSRVTGSRYGGIQAYWLSEAKQITTSKPTFRKMKLEPHELAVLVPVTDKLLRNSQAALTSYLERASIEEIQFFVGDAIVTGTGAGKPLGLLASTANIEVPKETSQVAATVVEGNLRKMWHRLHPRCRANAVWLINADVGPSLDILSVKILNVAGSENVGGFKSGIYDAEKNTIMGRPVIICEFCPTIGTVGDVILTDLKWYATGTRAGGVSSASSIHLRFDYAETVFRFMFEADGQPWLASAITPFKGTTTQSSIMTTAVRA